MSKLSDALKNAPKSEDKDFFGKGAEVPAPEEKPEAPSIGGI